MEDLKKEKYFLWVVIITIMIIALPILILIVRFGVDIPFWDQWEYVSFFDHLSKGTLTLQELFYQHNEYRQLFPNIVFVCLGWFTNWNVRYEMIVIFLMAAITSYNLFRLSEITFKGKKWQKLTLLVLSNIFIFSPSQFENWLFGVQIVYFMPIVCTTTGLLICYSSLNKNLSFFYCLFLGIISALSSVNGFLYWFVVFPVLFIPLTKTDLKKNWPKILLWVITAILTIFIYLHNYRLPENELYISGFVNQPKIVILYFFNLLGNPFGFEHFFKVPFWSGFSLVLVYLLFFVYFILHFGNRELINQLKVWLMLGAFSLLTGLMITIGRVGLGIEQSLSSRYITFILYLIISVFYMTSIVLDYRKTKPHSTNLQKYLFYIISVLLILYQLSDYPSSLKKMKAYHNSIQRAKAGLLFIEFIDHSKCQNKIYPSNFSTLKKKAHLLDSLGYLRPGLIKSNVVEQIEGTELKNADFGTFDLMRMNSDSTFTVSGFAKLPYRNESADAILLTYKNLKGESILFALENSGNPEWKMSVPVSEVPVFSTEINAWAFDAKTGKAYCLKHSHEFSRY